ISGRIGRALVTEGALVRPEDDEALAVIRQLDPVYVDFMQPARDLLRLRRALADGTMAGPDGPSVRILLHGGGEHPHAGRLLLAEAEVDPTTGEVLLRAEAPNPEETLLPGMRVRVLLEHGARE